MRVGDVNRRCCETDEPQTRPGGCALANRLIAVSADPVPLIRVGSSRSRFRAQGSGPHKKVAIPFEPASRMHFASPLGRVWHVRSRLWLLAAAARSGRKPRGTLSTWRMTPNGIRTERCLKHSIMEPVEELYLHRTGMMLSRDTGICCFPHHL